MGDEHPADPELKRDGIEMASAAARQGWEVDDNGFVFNIPEAWKRDNLALYTYPGYERLLAVWDIIDTIEPLCRRFVEPF